MGNFFPDFATLEAQCWERMQRDGWQLLYHRCYFSKMKFKCMECLREGAWWDLFSNGDEGGTLRSCERHGLDLCRKCADTKECSGFLTSITVPFSMHLQGHIFTKNHMRRKPPLTRTAEMLEQRPWDDLLYSCTGQRKTPTLLPPEPQTSQDIVSTEPKPMPKRIVYLLKSRSRSRRKPSRSPPTRSRRKPRKPRKPRRSRTSSSSTSSSPRRRRGPKRRKRRKRSSTSTSRRSRKKTSSCTCIVFADMNVN